ncbi:hypothetical protein [Paracnuella aquatica]|uniref:hypothetical protein n=1 Tax=Paracnuella aquatica TaxID=2268757 RepID=UPI000F4D53DD|nr:hypothetical protein [Paracnuella aquatica]RPD44781.1 hypothetical protein DRJ53_16635 [Paracnuella aquatica]
MRILPFFLLLLSFESFAQCKSFIIGVKGDTLNCVDVAGKRQGRWVERIENAKGERGYEEQGFYHNGMKEGQWQRFSLEGDLLAIENYKWGYKNGKSVYMTPMGDPVREESWKAVNPENPYDTVDVIDPDNPGRIIEKRVIKLEGTALRHGTWRYYDTFSGKLEKKEEYIFDKIKTEGEAGIDGLAAEDDLAPIDVTGAGKKPAYKPKTEEEKKKMPKPQAVIDFEKKNAGKKKVRVRDGSTF